MSQKEPQKVARREFSSGVYFLRQWLIELFQIMRTKILFWGSKSVSTGSLRPGGSFFGFLTEQHVIVGDKDHGRKQIRIAWCEARSYRNGQWLNAIWLKVLSVDGLDDDKLRKRRAEINTGDPVRIATRCY